MFVAQLQNATLTLTQDDGVGEFGMGQARAGWEVAEEIRVEVKRVDLIVFENVDQKNALEVNAIF